MTSLFHDQKRFVFMFVCSTVVALAGLNCSRIHSHLVINESAADVYNVKIISSGENFMHGVLITGASAGYGGSFKVTGNDQETISWTDVEGRQFFYDVHVPRYASSKEVAFIIRNDVLNVERRDW